MPALTVTNAAAPQVPDSGYLEPSMHKIATRDSILLAPCPKDPGFLAKHLRECLPKLDNPESLLLAIFYAPTLLPATHSEAASRILRVLRSLVQIRVFLTTGMRAEEPYDATWAARLPKLPKRLPAPYALPTLAPDLRLRNVNLQSALRSPAMALPGSKLPDIGGLLGHASRHNLH